MAFLKILGGKRGDWRKGQGWYAAQAIGMIRGAARCA